jgi:hypothetical protein
VVDTGMLARRLQRRNREKRRSHQQAQDWLTDTGIEGSRTLSSEINPSPIERPPVLSSFFQVANIACEPIIGSESKVG